MPRLVRPAVPLWGRAEDVGAGRYRTRFQNLTFHLMGFWGRSEIWVWWWYGADLVTKSCPSVVTPWTVARQAPLSIGFPGQGYWSWLPFPSPRDLPDPVVEPRSPALQADSPGSLEPDGPDPKHAPLVTNPHLFWFSSNSFWNSLPSFSRVPHSGRQSQNITLPNLRESPSWRFSHGKSFPSIRGRSGVTLHKDASFHRSPFGILWAFLILAVIEGPYWCLSVGTRIAKYSEIHCSIHHDKELLQFYLQLWKIAPEQARSPFISTVIWGASILTPFTIRT